MLSVAFGKTGLPHTPKMQNSIKIHVFILKDYLMFACHLLRVNSCISTWKLWLKSYF